MATASPSTVCLLSPASGDGDGMYLGDMTMTTENQLVWDDNYDDDDFYIGGQESPTTSTPAERRDDGEVENDHYFEMRQELNGWE